MIYLFFTKTIHSIVSLYIKSVRIWATPDGIIWRFYHRKHDYPFLSNGRLSNGSLPETLE